MITSPWQPLCGVRARHPALQRHLPPSVTVYSPIGRLSLAGVVPAAQPSDGVNETLCFRSSRRRYERSSACRTNKESEKINKVTYSGLELIFFFFFLQVRVDLRSCCQREPPSPTVHHLLNRRHLRTLDRLFIPFKTQWALTHDCECICVLPTGAYLMENYP